MGDGWGVAASPSRREPQPGSSPPLFRSPPSSADAPRWRRALAGWGTRARGSVPNPPPASTPAAPASSSAGPPASLSARLAPHPPARACPPARSLAAEVVVDGAGGNGLRAPAWLPGWRTACLRPRAKHKPRSQPLRTRTSRAEGTKERRWGRGRRSRALPDLHALGERRPARGAPTRVRRSRRRGTPQGLEDEGRPDEARCHEASRFEPDGPVHRSTWVSYRPFVMFPGLQSTT